MQMLYMSPSSISIKSLRFDDGNVNHNATNQWFDSLNEENDRAAHAARFLVQCFDVVWQMTTWNFHIWDSYDNGSSQQLIFHSLPLHENHSCQASESALRLFCTTWSTWNNRKRLNLTQSSILMWSFPCTCRRSFLNSLIKLKWPCCDLGVQRQEYPTRTVSS